MDFKKLRTNISLQIQRVIEFAKKNHKTAGVIVLAGILVIALVVVRFNAQKNLSTSQDVYVQVENVEATSIGDLSELSGTLEPIEEATVSFEVSGTVESLNVQEGSSVNAGENLAGVDSKNYDLQAQQAGNQLQSAETAYNLAATDFTRYESLYNAGAISQSDYEKAKYNLDVAQNGVNSATTAQQQANLALSKTSLKSPINGVIISKYISKGQLVSAGTPAYKIGDIDKLKVSLLVPDSQISSWKIGDKISVKLYEESVTGEVTNIFPATDEKTGAITVEVTVNNAEHKWYSGQVVTCSHNAGSGTAIYVPNEAVISNSESSAYVFILKNDEAVKTPVTIGTIKNNLLEIKSGLNANDQLITKGADRLSDGDKVKVIESEN
jgi:RND family efflux transporter MFP subunit